MSSPIILFITTEGTTDSSESFGDAFSSDELFSVTSGEGLLCWSKSLLLPVLPVLLVLMSHAFVFPAFPMTSFLRLFWNQILKRR